MARVLIAEDDLALLDALAAIVTNAGHEVVKARDGGELLEAIAETSFDLIITDVSMPWMSGLQAGSSARYAGLPTPILVISALKDPALEADVAALGAPVRLLRKPLDFDLLEDAVATLTHTTLGGAPAQS